MNPGCRLLFLLPHRSRQRATILRAWGDEQLRRLVRGLRSATNELHDAHHAPRDDREAGFRKHLVVVSDLLDGVPP